MPSKLHGIATFLALAYRAVGTNVSADMFGGLGSLFPDADDLNSSAILVGAGYSGNFGAGGPKKIFTPVIITKESPDQRNVEIAGCVINAIQSAQYLAIAGLQIKGSVGDCPQGVEPRAMCAADIAGIIAAFTGVASFLSGCAASCPEVANIKAGCASNIIGVVNHVAQLVQASSSISVNCPKAVLEREKFEGGSNARRLRGENATLDPERRLTSAGYPTPTEMATCVIDASTAAGWLSKAGLQIKASIGSCPSDDETICASNVMGIFASFVTAGSFLANVAEMCVAGMNTQAVCAANIQQLIANLDGLAQSALTLKHTCGDVTRLV